MLARAYARRKQFEAKLLARDVISALAEAMRGEDAAPGPQAPAHRVPATMKPKDLLAMLGVSLDPA